MAEVHSNRDLDLEFIRMVGRGHPDGRLLVAGDFNHIGEVTRYGCARLNANGGLDATFQVGGPEAAAADYPLTGHAVRLQADGKILLAARFNSHGRTLLVRLEPNGAFDREFTPAELENYPSTLVMGMHGDSIYLAGSFQRVNGLARSGVVRLQGGVLCEPPLAIQTLPRTSDGLMQIAFPAIPRRRYAIEASVNLVNWEEAETITAIETLQPWSDRRTSEFPQRFYRVRRLEGMFL